MDKKQFKRVWSLLLCVVLLLGNVPVVSAEGEDHGVVEQLADHAAENQAAADAVAALIAALPALENIQSKPLEAQGEDYALVQSAYSAYEQLTEAQKELLPSAEETFETYFNYFNSLTQEAAATSGSCGTNVSWSFDSTTGILTISGTGAMEDYASANAAPWYQYKNSIVEVVIAEGVTRVGDNAFYDYNTYLTKITIADSVTTVGCYAFGDCQKVTELNFGKGLVTVEEGAFSYLKGLTSLKLPENLTTIEEKGFSSCQFVETLELPSSLRTIGPWAFQDMALTSLTIPEGVETIQECAFYVCGKLTSVSLPSSLKTIEYAAFSSTGLTSVTIPAGVTSMVNPFPSCNNLHSINVASGNTSYRSVGGFVYTADYKTFVACPSAKIGSYTINSIATEIAPFAFRTCKLTGITLPEGLKTIGESAFCWCKNLKTVTIPSSVTTIGKSAFEQCSALENVSLAEGVTALETYAFYYCSALKEITIPNTVTSLGHRAFGSCSSLSSVTIPFSVNTIDSYCFAGCSNLKTISFTGDAPVMNNYIFDYLTATCKYPASNETWTTDARKNYGGTINWEAYEPCEGGHSYDSDGVCAVCGDVGQLPSGTCGPNANWTYDPNTKTLTISGTGYMYSYENEDEDDEPAPWSAYVGELTTVVIQNGITSIGGYAFESCNSLTSVTMADSVATIGEYAFWNCNALTSVTIGEGVTRIMDAAFYDCANLKTVTIPSSVHSIYQLAFWECDSLTDVYYNGTKTQWGWITKGTNNTPLLNATIHYAYRCTSGHSYDADSICTVCGSVNSTLVDSGKCGSFLTWAVYENGLLNIVGEGSMRDYGDGSISPFNRYSSVITKVKLPDGIDLIGEYAFSHSYPNLAYIEVPLSVRWIRSCAFGATSFNIKLKYPGTMEQWKSIIHSSIVSYSRLYGAECSDGTILYMGNCGDDGEYPNVKYTLLGDGTLKLTGSGRMDFYRYLNYSSHFSNDDRIKVVEIEEGIGNIADYAFKDCENLTTIYIPASVTSISYDVFSGCTSLKDVYYGSNEKNWNEVYISTSGNGALANATIHYTDLCVNGHTWLEATCQSPKICEVCDATEGTALDHTYDQEIVNEEYLKTPATCTKQAEYYKTCVCGAKGTETFTVGEIVGHTRDENHKCTVCGHIGGTCGENATWEFDAVTGKLTISGTGATADYLVTTSDGGTTAPWNNAYRKQITEVSVGSGITALGDCAFRGCEVLATVSLPNTLQTIHDYVFFECAALEEITLPDGVTGIGQYTFAYCNNLKNVNIPDGITKIEDGTFMDCRSLAEIDIPDGVTSIGSSAFNLCKGLKEIDIPAQVTSIGHNAFKWCSGLKEVTLPDGMTSISGSTFLCCTGLTKVNIPDSVTSIGASAFSSCSNLTEIDLPEGVTSIGGSAFDGCSKLEKIDIPAGVTSIVYDTFSGCKRLAKINIPEGVTDIGLRAFKGCSRLTEVVLPASLTTIDANAFDSCSNLADVYYGDTSEKWETFANRPTGENLRVHYSCTTAENHWETINVDATCITDGYTAEACACATPYERNKQQTTPATGVHSFTAEIAHDDYLKTAATCTDKAVYYKSCVTCGEAGEETFKHGDVKPHTYTTVVTAPTCTADGYTTYTCSACGDNYTDDPVTQLGHTGGEATCKDKAICQRCQSAYGEVDPGNHTGGTELRDAKEATCTAAGYTGDTWCLDCQTKIADGETVPVKTHTYTSVVTAPTCTADGYTTYTCSACGDNYTDDPVTQLGHTGGEATCKDKAICQRCQSAYGEVDPGNHTGGTELRDAKEATCTAVGYTGDTWCLGCQKKIADGETVPVKSHTYTSVVTAPTCTADGYTTYTCAACGDTYTGNPVTKLGHDMGAWTLVKEPSVGVDGEECRICSRCNFPEKRPVQLQGNILKLDGEDFAGQSTVWIDGMPYPVQQSGSDRFVELPTTEDCMIVTYTYHVGNAGDVHTQYPTGMKVYKVSGGVMQHIPELDNLLQYSGCSIRITGNKGIRMITSLDKNTKAALTGSGLAGYKLVEYGTMLCWASEIASGDALTLGKSFTRSNFAYKRGVADPVFANSGNLTQYTNVLVGFSNEQCKDDIAMRPYIILEDAQGKQITLYGGTIYRSIGYIAYQNRTVFQPGTASYKYVWDIIHYVYGNAYDADYRG